MPAAYLYSRSLPAKDEMVIFSDIMFDVLVVGVGAETTIPGSYYKNVIKKENIQNIKIRLFEGQRS